MSCYKQFVINDGIELTYKRDLRQWKEKRTKRNQNELPFFKKITKVFARAISKKNWNVNLSLYIVCTARIEGYDMIL